jgi:ADP-ribose pyrophosphatase YjhB (NUDIX family)
MNSMPLPERRASAVVIVRRAENPERVEVLFAVRVAKPGETYPGARSLPSALIDDVKHESPADAARRAVATKLDVELETLRLLKSGQGTRPEPNLAGIRRADHILVEMNVFVATLPRNAEVTLNPNFYSDAIWLPPLSGHLAVTPTEDQGWCCQLLHSFVGAAGPGSLLSTSRPNLISGPTVGFP